MERKSELGDSYRFKGACITYMCVSCKPENFVYGRFITYFGVTSLHAWPFYIDLYSFRDGP